MDMKFHLDFKIRTFDLINQNKKKQTNESSSRTGIYKMYGLYFSRSPASHALVGDYSLRSSADLAAVMPILRPEVAARLSTAMQVEEVRRLYLNPAEEVKTAAEDSD